jgi:hypothetical protein
VSWDEVANIPDDIADGDDIGITIEIDPTVNDLAKAPLSCADGQVAKWNGTDWMCEDDIDTDTQLSKAAVDGYVANNGYLITETDPKVGTFTTKRIPKWDDSQLIDSSSIFEDESGNVGIARRAQINCYTSSLLLAKLRLKPTRLKANLS